MTVSEARRRLSAPTVGDALWAGLILLYIFLRLPAVTKMPVAGVELFDLTAAWQAHFGGSSATFQPTLAQAIALFSFEWTESPQFVRWVVFAVGMTVPFAFYFLRSRIGEVGAAVALLFVALSGPGLYVSSAASATALDVAVIAWTLVWLDRGYGPDWLWVPAGFLASTAGPMFAALLLPVAVVHFARGGRLDSAGFRWGLAGAAVGLVVASLQFGYGAEGVAVPPLHHFVNGYGAELDAGAVGLLAPLYLIPVLGFGAAGVLTLLLERRRTSVNPSSWWLTVLTWWLLTLFWLASSLTSGSAVPLAAAVMPSALLAGYGVEQWAKGLEDYEWRWPLLAFAGAGAALTAAGVVLAAWARRGDFGSGWDLLILIAGLLAAFMVLALVAIGRRTMPTLVLATSVPAAILVVVGTMGVAFGAADEPLFSPTAEKSGRDLRDLAVQAKEDIGGSIVVHASLEDDIAWPFRGIPSYALVRRIPQDAAVVILPVAAPPPDGFFALENEWRLSTQVSPPSGPLEFVHWLTDRHSVESTGVNVAVYLRTVE